MHLGQVLLWPLKKVVTAPGGLIAAGGTKIAENLIKNYVKKLGKKMSENKNTGCDISNCVGVLVMALLPWLVSRFAKVKK